MMLAFHCDPKIKRKYLARVLAHAKADEIIRGKYWEDGKGCAVGCTIHSPNHDAYETELGIPIALARLEDTLFEGQSNGKAKTFPARFLAAINPGADLSRVHWQFLHWLLTEELAARDHPLVAAAIKQCADVLVPLTKGMPVDRSARASARAAAAESAARASAESAAWAAESAASAASSAYARMADKLIELLAAVPSQSAKEV